MILTPLNFKRDIYNKMYFDESYDTGERPRQLQYQNVLKEQLRTRKHIRERGRLNEDFPSDSPSKEETYLKDCQDIIQSLKEIKQKRKRFKTFATIESRQEPPISHFQVPEIKTPHRLEPIFYPKQSYIRHHSKQQNIRINQRQPEARKTSFDNKRISISNPINKNRNTIQQKKYVQKAQSVPIKIQQIESKKRSSKKTSRNQFLDDFIAPQTNKKKKNIPSMQVTIRDKQFSKNKQQKKVYYCSDEQEKETKLKINEKNKNQQKDFSSRQGKRIMQKKPKPEQKQRRNKYYHQSGENSLPQGFKDKNIPKKIIIPRINYSPIEQEKFVYEFHQDKSNFLNKKKSQPRVKRLNKTEIQIQSTRTNNDTDLKSILNSVKDVMVFVKQLISSNQQLLLQISAKDKQFSKQHLLNNTQMQTDYEREIQQYSKQPIYNLNCQLNAKNKKLRQNVLLKLKEVNEKGHILLQKIQKYKKKIPLHFQQNKTQLIQQIKCIFAQQKEQNTKLVACLRELVQYLRSQKQKSFTTNFSHSNREKNINEKQVTNNKYEQQLLSQNNYSQEQQHKQEVIKQPMRQQAIKTKTIEQSQIRQLLLSRLKKAKTRGSIFTSKMQKFMKNKKYQIVDKNQTNQFISTANESMKIDQKQMQIYSKDKKQKKQNIQQSQSKLQDLQNSIEIKPVTIQFACQQDQLQSKIAMQTKILNPQQSMIDDVRKDQINQKTKQLNKIALE